MARKPHDNQDQLKAIAERRKALLLQRKIRLGEILQLAGADGLFDFDQIAGLLRDAIQRHAATPNLGEVWRQEGQALFRQTRMGRRDHTPSSGAHHPGGAANQGRGATPDRAPTAARDPAPLAARQLPLDPPG